jgi:hypothetical protein
MIWIVGLVAVIGFAYLMYANERFRRFGTGLLMLIGAGIAIIWFLTEKQSRDDKAERERELSAISASQITFSNLQLSDEGYGWRVTGSILNRSPHNIRALTLRVYLQECPSATSQQGCITTGQDDARFYVEVPAGQARQLDTSVQLANAATLGGGWSWQYAVTQIEADLD